MTFFPAINHSISLIFRIDLAVIDTVMWRNTYGIHSISTESIFPVIKQVSAYFGFEWITSNPLFVCIVFPLGNNVY